MLRHEKKNKGKIPQSMTYVYATKVLHLKPVSGMKASYFENPKTA
jgi:hypothetical protein